MTAVMGGADSADATALYQRCFGELVGYLDRLLADRGSAEDIAQEAGMRLIETARREPGALRQPRAFLFHVATNLARDHLRRRIRFEHVAAGLMEDLPQAPAADVVASVREEVAQLDAVLREMPARPREILVLSRLHGLSHAEIGERLGIAPKTVENHVGRGLALLAKRFGQRGGGD